MPLECEDFVFRKINWPLPLRRGRWVGYRLTAKLPLSVTKPICRRSLTFIIYNMTGKFCRHHKSRLYAIYFGFLSEYLSLNLYQTAHQLILCLILSAIFLLIPFAFLISLSPTMTKEYISGFNLPNSSIMFPITSSFILAITFLSRVSWNRESIG